MPTVHDLVKRLAGEAYASVEDPGVMEINDEYVEKLASAVEHLLADDWADNDRVKIARSVQQDPVVPMADVLRAGLVRRLAAKKNDAEVEERSVKDTILARLRVMRAPADAVHNDANTEDEEQDDESLFYDGRHAADTDEAQQADGLDESSATSEVIADDVDATSEAQAFESAPTLAGVLAASLGADEPDESTTSSGVKTAVVRGDVGRNAREAATSGYKRALLAKLGREA